MRVCMFVCLSFWDDMLAQGNYKGGVGWGGVGWGGVGLGGTDSLWHNILT